CAVSLGGGAGGRREPFVRFLARCLCCGRCRSGFSSSRKSCGGGRHRGALRRGAPMRALASPAQRYRRWPAKANERGGAVNAHLRRGACPALSQPMATGDGLLVRMTPTGATMSCQAFAALCAAARSCGNGVIEITSRGSLQIRGLTESSAQRFATAVGRIEVVFCEGPPVLINPLRGLDADAALDMSGVAAELRRVLAAAAFSADIGPKVSIALHGGGALHLDALSRRRRMRT